MNKAGKLQATLLPTFTMPWLPSNRDFVPLGEHEARVQGNEALKEQTSIATAGVIQNPRSF